ncbi:uncharacterized protein EV420DRAFT_1168420 [Desarmillaria tabescens]|uniref:Uncharacterized protein n=1 Tax=Armillaria tabescens TaxID=1929756 RepID=A0AA39JCB2_ARMTA|nr:uncharacterized protein EV420DRAFT_1168420 [Desarmillaria tabescens]KAK0439973.1 hypothetical protein EV420DRAFT_1168420 [Desarmillaria tabescens]
MPSSSHKITMADVWLDVINIGSLVQYRRDSIHQLESDFTRQHTQPDLQIFSTPPWQSPGASRTYTLSIRRLYNGPPLPPPPRMGAQRLYTAYRLHQQYKPAYPDCRKGRSHASYPSHATRSASVSINLAYISFPVLHVLKPVCRHCTRHSGYQPGTLIFHDVIGIHSRFSSCLLTR